MGIYRNCLCLVPVGSCSLCPPNNLLTCVVALLLALPTRARLRPDCHCHGRSRYLECGNGSAILASHWHLSDHIYALAYLYRLVLPTQASCPLPVVGRQDRWDKRRGFQSERRLRCQPLRMETLFCSTNSELMQFSDDNRNDHTIRAFLCSWQCTSSSRPSGGGVRGV
jgi:hypothetical protein